MILNTGQRTDIPAFFSKWFMNRINEGFVLVRNPYNPSSITKYEIRPDIVDLIGFCTKNPEPMLPFIKEIDERGFGQFWFVTITPYGRDVEPNVPNKHKTLEIFKTLSSLVGLNRIAWRYDPIFINEKYTADYHRRAFEKMCTELSGFTDTCVISFIDLYPKVTKNFPEVHALTTEEKIILGKDLIQIARAHNILIRTCGEGNLLEHYGAITSGCMTPEIYERAAGVPLKFPHYKPSRSECACYLSCDIGAYSTCVHYCRYCYANSNPSAIQKNLYRHDPNSPFLIGGSLPTDKIHQAQQNSWKIKTDETDGQNRALMEIGAESGQQELF